MSQSGQLVFFAAHECARPRQVLEAALRLTGATRIAFASRAVAKPGGWEVFQRSLTEPPPPGQVTVDDDDVIVMVDEDDVPTEIVGRLQRVEDAVNLIDTDGCLTIHVGPNPLGPRIAEAINMAIPGSVRGEFVPTDPIICIGYHDIFECAEHDEGFLFGRAFFSFRLFGYGTPLDWTRYRKEVFNVGAIKALKADLEEIIGPLDQCIYWSI